MFTLLAIKRPVHNRGKAANKDTWAFDGKQEGVFVKEKTLWIRIPGKAYAVGLPNLPLLSKSVKM